MCRVSGVKPWVGTSGRAASRMVDSTSLKGPGGGGWLYEWYAALRETALEAEVMDEASRLTRKRRHTDAMAGCGMEFIGSRLTG